MKKIWNIFKWILVGVIVFIVCGLFMGHQYEKELESRSGLSGTYVTAFKDNGRESGNNYIVFWNDGTGVIYGDYKDLVTGDSIKGVSQYVKWDLILPDSVLSIGAGYTEFSYEKCRYLDNGFVYYASRYEKMDTVVYTKDMYERRMEEVEYVDLMKSDRYKSYAYLMAKYRLEEMLNDPGSLKVDKYWVSYSGDEDMYEVKIVYIAKNGFGAYVKEDVSFEISGREVSEAYK